MITSLRSQLELLRERMPPVKRAANSISACGVFKPVRPLSMGLPFRRPGGFMLVTRFDKLSQQLHSPSDTGPISGSAEVEEQTPSGGQEQSRLGSLELRSETGLPGEFLPVGQRIFEDAGVVARVAKRQRVQLEDQAYCGLRPRRAHALPVPAQELGQGARVFPGLEPGAYVSILTFPQTRQDLAHQSFARAEVVNQHASVGLQGSRQGTKGQVANAVGEHVIDSQVAEAFANGGVGRSGHGKTP